MSVEAQLARARQALEEAQEEIARLSRLVSRFPTEPSVGTVLRFSKKYTLLSGSRYTYVALSAGRDRWFLTGNKTAALTWENLVDFIGDEPCSVAADWHDLDEVANG